MAETVVINIEANTQGLQSTIDLLVKLGKVEQSVADDFKKTNEANVASLNKGVTATKKGIEDLGKAIKTIKADNTLAASLDATAPLAKTGNSLQSLGAKLKQAKTEAQELAAQFGNLDPRAIEAAKSVSELQSQINNTNKVIAAVNPDAKFNAIKNLGGAIGGIFTVATGAIQAFGVESEQATKIAQQFQGALNIFGGLSQLGQFKDALVEVQAALGLTKAAAVTGAETVIASNAAAAASFEGEALAAEGAAVANEGFAASLSLTGIGAIVVVLGAVAAAMMAVGDESKKAADETKRLKEALAGIKQSNQNIVDTKDKLLVAEGKITQGEAERRALQRKSFEEQVAVQVTINKLKKEETDNNEKVLNLQKLITAASTSTREGAALQVAGYQQQIDAAQQRNKEIEKLLYVHNKQKAKIDEDYSLKFKLSKTEEVKAAEDADEKKLKSAKKTNDELVKEAKPLSDEQDYANALKIIEQYYNEQEYLATKDLTNKQEIKAAISKLEEEKFGQQVEAAKQFNQDYFKLLLDRKMKEEQAAPGANVDARAEEQKRLFSLIDQYYTEEQQSIILTATTQEEADRRIKESNKAKFEEQIKALKSLGLSSKELEAQLKELDLADPIVQQMKDLQGQVRDALANLGFDLLNQAFENQISNIENLKQVQLDSIQAEEDALQKSYENRLIGKQELENGQAIATQKRVAAEKKAEQEIIALKRKQDIANRAKALFEIAINTAVNITKTPALTGLYIALGAVQAAAVLAQPLPKYKKGTLSVGGVGSEDTELALLQPGEAVIPTDTNRRYAPAIKAIYNGSIKPEDINAFVSMRLKGDIGGGGKQGVTAKMDVADLYTLGRIMKRNDGVTVKNLNELAVLLSNSHNPRR